MHVHFTKMSALTVYTAHIFTCSVLHSHALCTFVRALRCAPHLKTDNATCAPGARFDNCTAGAPRSSEVHCCTKKVTEFFKHFANSAITFAQHCRHDILLCSKMFQYSTMPCRPFTARFAKDGRF